MRQETIPCRLNSGQILPHLVIDASGNHAVQAEQRLLHSGPHCPCSCGDAGETGLPGSAETGRLTKSPIPGRRSGAELRKFRVVLPGPDVPRPELPPADLVGLHRWAVRFSAWASISWRRVSKMPKDTSSNSSQEGRLKARRGGK